MAYHGISWHIMAYHDFSLCFFFRRSENKNDSKDPMETPPPPLDETEKKAADADLFGFSLSDVEEDTVQQSGFLQMRWEGLKELNKTLQSDQRLTEDSCSEEEQTIRS